MNTLRYVVLGAGGIAGAHVNWFNGQPDVKPVGFQDIYAPTLENWKKKYPDAEIDADADKLLARTKPDIVTVCAPNNAHLPLTEAGYRHGAHVLCEKPMAMNVAESETMEKARKAAGKLGAINFSYRNVAAFRFAREIISAGEIGKIQRLNVRYLQSFLGAEMTRYSWRNDLSIAGFGALGDLGVHMIDGARFVTNLNAKRTVGLAQTLVPSKVDAAGKTQMITTDTNASFLIEYESGAIGTFETSQVVPGYGNFFHIEISGDKGVIRFTSEDNDNIGLLASSAIARYGTWGKENIPKVTIPTDFVGRQPKSTPESFVKAIRGEKVEYATFEDGIKAQRVLNGIVDSMESRGWVNL